MAARTTPRAPDASACRVFDETFDELDTEVWDQSTDTGGTIGILGGVLTLDADPDAAYTYLDVHRFEATSLAGFTVVADLSITIEGEGDAALVLSLAETDYIGIAADSGLITGIRDFGDFESFCSDSCQLYDADEYRFWRIQERDDELHFEYSADGGAWGEIAPAQPVPAGDHQVFVWAEAAAGNRAVAEIQRVFTSCE